MYIHIGEVKVSKQNVIVPFYYENDTGETITATLTNTESSLTVEEVIALLQQEGERQVKEKQQEAAAVTLAKALSGLEIGKAAVVLDVKE